MAGVDSVLSLGRYGIEEYLASGTTGVIFRGYDPVLARPVVIKMLRRELALGWNEQFKARARAAARLFHPNIVAMLDFGEDHDTPYRVSECVDGPSLARLLETSGPLAPQQAISMISQVLEALKYSHANGILHLDIKSSSVLVLADDRVKLADFGTSPVDAVQPVWRVPTAFLAPEQLTGTAVDERTDVFAVGVLLFDMITRTKPFSGDDLKEIVAQMEMRGPEDLCALNPEASSSLGRIIETALAYDPGRRFATANAFLRALQRSPPVANVAPRSGDRVGWEPEVLREIEAALARHIGPVASVAVRRAASRIHDVAELCEVLAAHIENDRERQEFLAKARRVGVATGERLVSPTADHFQADEVVTSGGTVGRAPDLAALDAVEAQLARYVGPIARVLVKQQSHNFASLSELYQNLAEYIPDDTERIAFLNSARAGRGATL